MSIGSFFSKLEGKLAEGAKFSVQAAKEAMQSPEYTGLISYAGRFSKLDEAIVNGAKASNKAGLSTEELLNLRTAYKVYSTTVPGLKPTEKMDGFMKVLGDNFSKSNVENRRLMENLLITENPATVIDRVRNISDAVVVTPRPKGGPVDNPRNPTPASTGAENPTFNIDARNKSGGTKDMGDADEVSKKRPDEAPAPPAPPQNPPAAGNSGGGGGTPPNDRAAFVASLQQGKWKTEVPLYAFRDFEDSLKKDGKLYSGTNILQDLGRKQFTKIDDILDAARNNEPISVEELVRLRNKGGTGVGANPKFPTPPTTTMGMGMPATGSSLDVGKFLVGAKGWLNSVTPSLSGLTFRTVESFRWSGASLGTISRATATAALAYGLLGYVPDKFSDFANADLSKLSVSQDRGWGLVAKRMDDWNILSDTLETAIGNKETHWISDQEYDKLIKGGQEGKPFNTAFVDRIKTVTGQNIDDQKYVTKTGEPEAWRNLYELGRKLQTNQTTFNSQIMVALNAAFSRNIGMNKDAGTANDSLKDGEVSSITTSDPETIVKFIGDRYVSSVAQKMGEDPKYRQAFIEKYYGSAVDSRNTLAMVQGLAAGGKSNDSFALDRKAIARFLVTQNASIGDEKSLLDEEQRQQVIAKINAAKVEANSKAALNAPIPAPLVSGLQPSGLATPSVVKQYELDGETFDNRLKGITYNNPALYTALSDAFKKSTSMPVKPEQELTSVNKITSSEATLFAQEARNILAQQKYEPEIAEKIVQNLTKPTVGELSLQR